MKAYRSFYIKADEHLQSGNSVLRKTGRQMKKLYANYYPRLDAEFQVTQDIMTSLSLRKYFKEDNLKSQNLMPPEAITEITLRDKELRQANFEYRNDHESMDEYMSRLRLFRFKLNWPEEFEIRPLGTSQEQFPRDGNEMLKDAFEFPFPSVPQQVEPLAAIATANSNENPIELDLSDNSTDPIEIN